MSEFRVDVPLAMTEDFGDFQCSEDIENQNSSPEQLDNNSMVDNNCFMETFSSSLEDLEDLEDLVKSFDEKIIKCFHNYDENVSNLAPVQVRSQEEVINESQMWWTLTGNFGNILPIDWSKTYARKLHLPALNINERNGDQMPTNMNELFDPNCDEEELAKDLDLHSLILASLQRPEPLFTAEQVLEEIDEIMMNESMSSSAATSDTNSIDKSPTNSDTKKKTAISALVYDEKLRTLSTNQLNELYIELETMIQQNSETLIHELALRDELDFEKELKNNFISLLLSVQNKRRQHHIDRKRGRGLNELKYLTTVIPYHTGRGPPDVSALQTLIKILRAVNEDSPTVPTLLTDYILKVICPT